MRMAKSTDRVATFLSDLAMKLQQLKHEELQLFLEYKKEDVSFFFVGGVSVGDVSVGHHTMIHF